MCGIAGGWESHSGRGVVERTRSALAAMRHRGPDDQGEHVWERTGGVVSLGSTRLSVQDLSQAGHMPMVSVDERFVLAYNGEITNFVEVRAELVALGRRFASSGDTEVLLQAWEQWGSDSLSRFEGMFAFAMLDRSTATLTLARDAFGVKPLYYAYEPGESLYFSSEAPGLMLLRPSGPRLDWQTAFDFIRWGTYDGGERTFVEGARQLKSGHVVSLDLAAGVLGEPVQFWTPSVKPGSKDSFDDAAERVRDLFLTSLERNLRSDVAVGVALSGGIDSSAITAGIRHIAPDYELRTFSFVAPGFDQSEHEWIDLVVQETGAESFRVTPNADDLAGDLDDMIRTQGEPFGTTSIYAQYRVFRLARESGVTVTLDGQGADELFAGYNGYPAARVRTLLERGKFGRARRLLREWQEWPGRPPSSTVVDTAVRGMLPSSLVRTVERVRSVESPAINYARLAEHGVRVEVPRLGLPGVRGRRLSSALSEALTVRGVGSLLRHGDRNSMRFSVESRVPFLDRALVDYTLGLPEEYLLDDRGTTKAVLRKALRGIVPDVILDRRDKIGFATPQDSWLDQMTRETMTAGRDRERIGFLRTDDAALDLLANGRDDDLQLASGVRWRILNLRRWIELFDIDAA
ncbi:asparagine synthase (glutamine-hydrolyzing) [Agromyces sp. NPDC055520]